jgi:hypothetical protein
MYHVRNSRNGLADSEEMINLAPEDES